MPQITLALVMPKPLCTPPLSRLANLSQRPAPSAINGKVAGLRVVRVVCGDEFIAVVVPSIFKTRAVLAMLEAPGVNDRREVDHPKRGTIEVHTHSSGLTRRKGGHRQWYVQRSRKDGVRIRQGHSGSQSCKQYRKGLLIGVLRILVIETAPSKVLLISL
jgi:hypothetical protein